MSLKGKRKRNINKYKQSVCSDSGKKDISVNNDQWPIGTTVIVDESILSGIVEEKLCGQGRLVKVKRFSSSTVDDLSHHIIPIIQKKSTNMIMHIGANDAPSSTSREIPDNLLKLISLVNEKLPHCKVCLSTPTLRTNNGKAFLTVSRLVNHLLNLNIDVIDDRNIKTRHLSRKGLHLNDSGSKLLARNFLEKMRLFWVDKTCSSIIKDNGLGYPLKDDSYDIPSGKTGHKKKHIEKSKGFGEKNILERKISIDLL